MKKDTVRKTIVLSERATQNLELLSAADGKDMSTFITNILTNQRYSLLASLTGPSKASTAPIADLIECYINRSLGTLTAEKSLALLQLLEKIVPGIQFQEYNMRVYRSYVESIMEKLFVLDQTGIFSTCKQQIEEETFMTDEGISGFLSLCLANIKSPLVAENDLPFRIFNVLIMVSAWKTGYSCKTWYKEIRRFVNLYMTDRSVI